MNDLDRLAGSMDTLTAAVVANTVAVERQNALLERSVAADEAMAALTEALLPGAGAEPIDVDALDWLNAVGSGYTVDDGAGGRRNATADEAAAIAASIRPTTRRGR